ncbi:MAG: asparaginase [Fusobacteriaceae bacterium]|jgi:L-asparaginase II|nr:asparaginase [Fusobacteriaceae bacterium]
MDETLVEVTRGEVVESRHRGCVVVADGDGKVLASAGSPELVTYIRSAAKPMQALNIIFSGADKKFDLSTEELALMCSSHYGETMHRQVIYRVLEKLGLSTRDLLCGAPLSINPAQMRKQLSEHEIIDETCSDCSGKHCGFLAVCLARGYPIAAYNRPDHPMQREILEIMSRMCALPADKIKIGVDGCSVPVHAMPILNMARGYARFAAPDQLESNYRAACEKIFDAMNAAPEMIAGTGGFCTEFLKATGGRFCGKIGAEGLYCIGVKGKNMGIAVKISDGNFRALYPAVMHTLKQLDLLSPEEIAGLAPFAEPDNLNDTGVPIGKLTPVFTLH